MTINTLVDVLALTAEQVQGLGGSSLNRAVMLLLGWTLNENDEWLTPQGDFKPCGIDPANIFTSRSGDSDTMALLRHGREQFECVDISSEQNGSFCFFNACKRYGMRGKTLGEAIARAYVMEAIAEQMEGKE